MGVKGVQPILVQAAPLESAARASGSSIARQLRAPPPIVRLATPKQHSTETAAQVASRMTPRAPTSFVRRISIVRLLPWCDVNPVPAATPVSCCHLRHTPAVRPWIARRPPAVLSVLFPNGLHGPVATLVSQTQTSVKPTAIASGPGIRPNAVVVRRASVAAASIKTTATRTKPANDRSPLLARPSIKLVRVVLRTTAAWCPALLVRLPKASFAAVTLAPRWHCLDSRLFALGASSRDGHGRCGKFLDELEIFQS